MPNSRQEILSQIHSLELEVQEMESIGFWKWLCFDPIQLSYWLRIRKRKILELRQQLELAA